MPDPAPALDILETEFLCGGVLITVATQQIPGETIEALSARHDEEVKEKEKECQAAPMNPLPIVTSWQAVVGKITYSSPLGTQVKHDANVVKLKKIYPAT